jgi:hypothetical protein
LALAGLLAGDRSSALLPGIVELCLFVIDHLVDRRCDPARRSTSPCAVNVEGCRLASLRFVAPLSLGGL